MGGELMDRFRPGGGRVDRPQFWIAFVLDVEEVFSRFSEEQLYCFGMIRCMRMLRIICARSLRSGARRGTPEKMNTPPHSPDSSSVERFYSIPNRRMLL